MSYINIWHVLQKSTLCELFSITDSICHLSHINTRETRGTQQSHCCNFCAILMDMSIWLAINKVNNYLFYSLIQLWLIFNWWIMFYLARPHNIHSKDLSFWPWEKKVAALLWWAIFEINIGWNYYCLKFKNPASLKNLQYSGLFSSLRIALLYHSTCTMINIKTFTKDRNGINF